jgi:hypothetical protein
MFEINSGYAIGFNLDNAIPIEAKITYSFTRIGFVLEAGSLIIPDQRTFHFFLGPSFYILKNSSRWRIPFALGFDQLSFKDNNYYGFGGIIALHYRIMNHLYAGFDIGFVYYFNNIYAELTGYRTIKTVFDDGTIKTQTVPIIENKNHFGNYFYFKPKILIGLQI